MHKTTQRDNNPYPYSDSNKRYQTFDYYTRTRFGGKCAKVTLDIGCTCPNKASGGSGCIYCKNGSRSAIGRRFGRNTKAVWRLHSENGALRG